MGQWFSTDANTESANLASSVNQYLKNFKLESRILSEETRVLIQYFLEKGDVPKAISIVNSVFKVIENAPLSIAVTGESGAGKSTLINALRGMGHEEEGSAATGAVETTMERTEYKHPKFPNVSIWDLPGIGTTNFPPEKYLREVKFAEYDFFLLVSAARFKYSDAELAKAIAKMKKNFYFVRTKIDMDLASEEKAKPTTFRKDVILGKMSDDCVKNLQGAQVTASEIFLVSSLDRSDYDFPKLETTLLRDLPAHKRHIFMQCLPSVTEAAIDRKRDALKQMMFLDALKRGATATIPFTGHVTDKDIEKLEEILTQYRSDFGLDDASLENVAKDLHVSVQDLKANLQSPRLLSADSHESLVENLKEGMEAISSVTGEFIAAGLYFTMVFYLQYYFLDTVASDAKALLNKEDLFHASGSYD
ncbi:PREDICTED: interferon-inducible GTPase 1-like [Chinchilla lanigera]|uniref:Interferon-inducible GTPase 1-like n=1 Tax=Chinchilla lanigera TaxID=34839 RepID=A0A8C2WEG2_CHILA|nr:PREDICTED: interferon-inducible GTPase 1-like [Chinchilla lanigera]